MITFSRLLSLGLVIGAMMPLPVSAATFTVGGTGAVTRALELVGASFTKETSIPLEVIPSLGSSGAIAATADGVLALAVAGRDLKEEEVGKGLRVAAKLRTPFGLVTSRAEPGNLKSSDIAGLYAADQPKWPDGSPVRIILRPVAESDNAVLGELFPGLTEAIEQARTRPDLSVAATDQDNATAAEATEGSLVGATLTQVMSEERDLRFVSIDGVVPSVPAFEDGSYPFGKDLFLVVPVEISPEAQAFLAFIETDAGKAALREAGILPAAN